MIKSETELGLTEKTHFASSPMARLRDSFRPIAPLAGTDVRYSVDERLAYHTCPALSLALIRDGVVAEAAAFGMADPQTNRTAGTETLFQAASMSKPIAAILALQLVQEGLDIDANINAYLKSWKVPLKSGEVPVTLRHLLSHRSGANTVRFVSLHPETPRPTTIGILEGRTPAVNLPLAFATPAGTEERYSNTGFTLIQLLIEDVSGRDMAVVAQHRIFDAIGISRTTFAQPLPASLRTDASVGHERGAAMDGVWRYQPQLAAAGLWTTPTDYAQLMIAFRNAAMGKDLRLLKAQTARAMLEPQGGEFGLGWMLSGHGASFRFGHTGSNQGYRSMAKMSLDSGDGIVAMANADTGKALYLEALHGLSEICGWNDLRPPQRRIIPVAQSVLQSLDGDFEFAGGIAPPFRLAAKGAHVERSRLDSTGRTEAFYLGDDHRFFCPDSIFSLELGEIVVGKVKELKIFELGQGEVARVERI